MRNLVLLAGLLLAAGTARADMYQDAGNAKLPEAQINLKIAPVSATSLGFKGDGTTDNTAALTAMFARTDSPTVYFPAGTYMVGCPTTTIAASAVSLLGAGAGSTTLKLGPGCALPADVFAWGARSGVRVSHLTFDLNNPPPPVARANVLFFYAYDGDITSGSVDHVRIVNGTSPINLIAVGATGGHTVQDFHVDNNYLHLTAASTGTNQCIVTTTNNGTGTITKSTVDRNTCVNSAIQTDGTYLSVSFNDVSGFNFGTGIFAPLTTSFHQTIIGNRIHDSGAARDVNAVSAGGIETPNNSVICNNDFYNLGGPAIVNFGKYNLLCSNVAYNGANVVGATGDEQAAYITPLYGGLKHGAYGRWVGNRAYDDRATPKQLYGYYEVSPGDAVPGISFSGNEFSGYGAGKAYRTVNPVVYGVPAVLTVADLPACGAATKHSAVAVSDQNGVPTYRGTLTGGGAIAVLAYCNGTSWEAH